MVGKTLNEQFEILSLLGEGGMSYVYKAKHLLLKKIVAVKMLRGNLLEQPNSMRRLQQEAVATGKLDHPNTVGVINFDLTPAGEPFLVMDYLEGQSLSQLLYTEKLLEPDRALPIFKQIAAALVHAHEKGLIHRDLKTSNVLLVDHEGNPDFVKIVDFGIAKIITPEDGSNIANLTMTGEIFGSPLAMSPEQCRGENGRVHRLPQ